MYNTEWHVQYQCILIYRINKWMNECPYTCHSVPDSPGGTAIRRGVLGGLHFILLHKFQLFLSYSRYFNIDIFYKKLPNNKGQNPVYKVIEEVTF
jgi:hypothetical protein